MITVDMILQLDPCWSTPSIERALNQADCSSWVGLFSSARDDGWKTCSLKDMHWLLVNFAALCFPETFRAWAEPTSHANSDARVSMLLDLAHRLDEARRSHD